MKITDKSEACKCSALSKWVWNC